MPRTLWKSAVCWSGRATTHPGPAWRAMPSPARTSDRVPATLSHSVSYGRTHGCATRVLDRRRVGMRVGQPLSNAACAGARPTGTPSAAGYVRSWLVIVCSRETESGESSMDPMMMMNARSPLDESFETGSGSFWASLFDLSFTHFITPKLIRTLYLLGMLIALIIAVGAVLVSFF